MKPQKDTQRDDKFNLGRFVAAQEHSYEVALSELRRGEKASHWMWFIFPQLEGLGTSPTARKYAIKTLDEAKAYLGHPILGPRLLECCRALLAHARKSASDIMGYPDDLKLHSSMTLFALAGISSPEFTEVLQKYFQGLQDSHTLQLLGMKP